MALKAIVDTLEGVEEHYHSLYTQKGNKYEFTGVEGFKTQADVDRVQQALNAERAQRTTFENTLKAWGDRKPEDVLPILDRLPELEAAAEAGKKKLDQTQIEGIVNGRLAPMQRDRDTYKTNYEAEAQKVKEYEAKDRQRTIFDAVRGLAVESKANPDSYSTPYGGLMLLAQQIFTVDAQGQVVVREGVPDLVHGTLAKDVLGDLQRKYPSNWPQSSGGGAPGGSGNGPGVTSNPFKTNDQTARNRFAKEHPDKVDKMVKDAGLVNPWDHYKGK